MTFSGRTAVVTGGTGALGSVCAGFFSDAGLHVAIPFSADGSASRISSRIPPDRVFSRKADLTDEHEVDSFVAETLKRFGRIDYLVNAAGGYAGGRRIDEVDPAEWDVMLGTNARTAFLMARRVIREMRMYDFGRIINIASMPALVPASNKGPYAIAKRAVITLTETIAEECKGTGITANAIAPSIILTQANVKSMPGSDTSRWVPPQEIAQLIMYLCSDEARSISGNVIRIFGGV